mgnify:FL=1
MSPELKEKLIKRAKSFAWRISVMAVLVAIDFLLAEAGALELPDIVTVLLGLAGGELTKHLNGK